MQHRLVMDKDQDLLPVISVDYMFPHRELPTLVVFDRRSKSIWCHPVPSKGIVHPYSGRVVLGDLEKIGYRRVVFKSDGEESLKALRQQVKDGWKGEIVPENNPSGQSKSNGEVERAVRSAQGLSRTLKQHVEIGIGSELGPRHPILTWILEHSGTLLNLYYRGEKHDGYTAFHRLRGRPWKIELPSIGECVEYKKRSVEDKLAKQWDVGIFCGIKETTTEKIIGTPQ